MSMESINEIIGKLEAQLPKHRELLVDLNVAPPWICEACEAVNISDLTECPKCFCERMGHSK